MLRKEGLAYLAFLRTVSLGCPLSASSLSHSCVNDLCMTPFPSKDKLRANTVSQNKLTTGQGHHCVPAF